MADNISNGRFPGANNADKIAEKPKPSASNSRLSPLGSRFNSVSSNKLEPNQFDIRNRTI